MKYLDWNGSLWADGNWTETPQIRTKPINNTSVYGYYNPTKSSGTSIGGYEWKNVSNWIFTRNDWLTFDVWSSPLYNSLSETDKKTVIWLLNLQTDPNSLTTRMWYDKWQAQKLINAAQDINPAWKQDDFGNWQKVRQWWEKWKQGWWISRNWTAMKAAKELYDLADEIDKFPSMTLNWLKNAAAEEFWDPKIVKARMDEILNQKMTKKQLKTSIRQLVELLYWKNESEAMSVWEATYIKPNTPWIKDVADWMYNDLWIRWQEQYYNYTPTKSWWGAVSDYNNSIPKVGVSVWDWANLTPDQMATNIFTN